MNNPLTLYIHMPWCVRKCPYCDFNSHELKQDLPEQTYIDALLEDLTEDLPLVWGRRISAIFFGGGTPSLFSPASIARLLSRIHQLIPYHPDIEITLEANPGTVEQERFQGFREAGINRLSIGIQSFDDAQLKRLGRIHDSSSAHRAIEAAYQSGFDNFNIDLMFGLPEQTIEKALADLATGIQHQTRHLSWYQLTIEPNTEFHHHPPILPFDDDIWEMQQAGQRLLQKHGFQQYEISAYSRPAHQCRHNRNYWEFGDYLGIGAGAHAKITDANTGAVTRYWKTRHPKAYQDPAIPYIQGSNTLQQNDLILEFMLNALRLYETISFELFTSTTGLQKAAIESQLNSAIERGLMTASSKGFSTTPLGKMHLNELLIIFS